MKVNELIKRARENKKISQRELGRRINKTGQYISHIENNDSANPSIDLLNDIAKALDVSVNELLGIETISASTDYRLVADLARSFDSKQGALNLEYDESFSDLMRKISTSVKGTLENYPAFHFYKYIHAQFGQQFEALLKDISSEEMDKIYLKSTEYTELLLKLKEKEVETKK